MTKDEYLEEVARIHQEWSKRVLERRAGQPPQRPFIAEEAEHEVEFMATAEDDDEYWDEVQELTRRYRSENSL